MLLLLSTALAGTLGVSASAPALLYVDGQPVPVAQGAAPVWLELAGGGAHVIEARTTSDRPITTFDLVVPDGLELQVEYRDRHFALIGARAVQGPAMVVVPGVNVRVGPGGSSVNAGGASVYVGGVGPGGLGPAPSVLVGPTAPPPVAPVATGSGGAAPTSTVPVPVEFRSVDGEWADVYVDGKKEAEFRVNTGSVMIPLVPGTHKVEIRDFMGKKVWDSGYLEVVPGPTMKLGFGENAGVEVYTHPELWRE